MSLCKSIKKRMSMLKTERQWLDDIWVECAEYHLPNRGRFLGKDLTKFENSRSRRTINNTSMMASRAFSAGLVSGMTNPAKPWFRLTTPDPALMDFTPVREWLYKCENIMRHVHAKSGLYSSLNPLYRETGVFGTGSMGVFQDFDKVMYTRQNTIGSFYVAVDGRGRVNTHYNRFPLTVAQLVERFGKQNCSKQVQNMYDKGHTENKVIIIHAVEPNDDRDHLSPLAKHKKFRSVYIEEKADDDAKPLFESGFDQFPYLVPRIDVIDGEAYASSCPGIDSLGDTKGLQKEERIKYKNMDLQNDPALQAQASLQKQLSGGVVPGQMVFVENIQNGVAPLYQPHNTIRDIREDIRETQYRIDHAFYKDLFLMIANRPNDIDTAREVAELHEEKLLMLSPLVENFNNDLYDPLIELTYHRCLVAGILPPPPPELDGLELKVEYMSTLTQAMKMLGIQSIERTMDFVGRASQLDPNALKKFNASSAITDVAEAYGAPPSTIRSDSEVQEQILAEQKQIQQQQAMDALSQAPDAMKKMSDAKTGQNSVLDRLMSNE